MHRMGVVAAYQHRRRKGAAIHLVGAAQGRIQALQGVGQEGGKGALHGVRAHFLVVEAAEHRNAARVAGVQECVERGVSAHKVIQLGSRNEFIFRSPNNRLLPVYQEHIAPQHLLRPHPQPSRQKLVECGGGKRAGREQRAQVYFAVRRKPAVHAVIHMDGQAGNDGNHVIERDQHALDAVLGFHHDAPGNRKRTVEPGVVDHAAVGFHVQTGVRPGPFERRVRLQLEGGRIGMRCGNLEMQARRAYIASHLERDDAGIVAHRVIRTARLAFPRPHFGQVHEARLVQARADCAHRVEHAGAFLDEAQQAFRRQTFLVGKPINHRSSHKPCSFPAPLAKTTELSLAGEVDTGLWLSALRRPRQAAGERQGGTPPSNPFRAEKARAARTRAIA